MTYADPQGIFSFPRPIPAANAAAERAARVRHGFIVGPSVFIAAGAYRWRSGSPLASGREILCELVPSALLFRI
jgi:hypothetical protein